MSNKFNTENYQSQISKAYNPNNSEDDVKALLEYFLELKSLKQGRVSGEIENVIQHLQDKISVKECTYNNSDNVWYKKPIGIVVLSITSILVASTIFHAFISPII